MLIAVSRMTAQGQISIPAEVRKRMHVRPGAELVWDLKDNGELVVRPKKFTLEDLRTVLHASGPETKATNEEINQARSEFWGSRWHRFEGQEPVN